MFLFSERGILKFSFSFTKRTIFCRFKHCKQAPGIRLQVCGGKSDDFATHHLSEVSGFIKCTFGSQCSNYPKICLRDLTMYTLVKFKAK